MNRRPLFCASAVLALIACASAASPVLAQQNGSAAPTAGGVPSPPGTTPTTIGEVVVTAQRRTENIQKVPIAVTAISGATIAANRIQSATDISGLAPGLVGQVSVGGNNSATFQLRGVTSTAGAPGQSAGVSEYIDGIYIGFTSASDNDLPDIASIEVLRGPQGTLFGRNSNGGAVSITTRLPSGQFGLRQELTFGDYDQFRSRTRLDLPAYGPFTASLTYLHTERTGDVRNLGGGTRFDSGPATGGAQGVTTSPDHLGDNNLNAVASNIRFHPNSSFDLIYRFDYSDQMRSDPAAGILGNPNDLAGALGPSLARWQSVPAAVRTPVSLTRPDAVNNWFVAPAHDVVQGHSLTGTYTANDHITFKDILAYRVDAAGIHSDIDAIGGSFLPNGAPLVTVGSISQNKESEWTNEFQFLYTSHLLNLTTGYYSIFQESGDGPPGIIPGVGGPVTSGTYVFNSTTQPYLVPDNVTERSRIHTYSQALYGQADLHLTNKLTLTGGLRETWDHIYGLDNLSPERPGIHEDYVNNHLTYLGNISYQLTPAAFLYGKVDTGYISGGELGGLDFNPETAMSYELGGKADFFDHTLRTNISLYDTSYRNLQEVGFLATTLTTSVLNIANARAKGVEFETTWIPPIVRGITIMGGLSYSDFNYASFNPLYLAVNGITAGQVLPFQRPKWTANGSVQYTHGDMPFNSQLLARLDGNFRSAEDLVPFFYTTQEEQYQRSPSLTLINARVALTQIPVAGGRAEVALWAKNLTDSAVPLSAIYVGYLSALYQPARTFGADINFDF